MLDLKQIELFYPEHLRPFKRNLLREYLQYKVLELIFDSKFKNNMIFMGGTAIHIIYGNNRFSEDLDFDNIELKINDFKTLSKIIERGLKLEGYRTDIKLSFKNAYRINIKFPGLLYNFGLSNYQEEILSIHIDAESQNFNYQPDIEILSKFDIYSNIKVVPVNILLAQKIVCIFKRKRTLGRDLYDSVFLFNLTKPDFGYIKLKMKIKDKNKLKQNLMKKLNELDLKKISKDVEPFLFNKNDIKKILNFRKIIENSEF